MSVLKRLYFAASIAIVAWGFAAGLHIPIWRDGWSIDAIGDRSDIAVCSFIAAWLFAGSRTAATPSPKGEG